MIDLIQFFFINGSVSMQNGKGTFRLNSEIVSEPTSGCSNLSSFGIRWGPKFVGSRQQNLLNRA